MAHRAVRAHSAEVIPVLDLWQSRWWSLNTPARARGWVPRERAQESSAGKQSGPSTLAHPHATVMRGQHAHHAGATAVAAPTNWYVAHPAQQSAGAGGMSRAAFHRAARRCTRTATSREVYTRQPTGAHVQRVRPACLEVEGEEPSVVERRREPAGAMGGFISEVGCNSLPWRSGAARAPQRRGAPIHRAAEPLHRKTCNKVQPLSSATCASLRGSHLARMYENIHSNPFSLAYLAEELIIHTKAPAPMQTTERGVAYTWS